jgi:hypothetical protein
VELKVGRGDARGEAVSCLLRSNSARFLPWARAFDMASSPAPSLSVSDTPGRTILVKRSQEATRSTSFEQEPNTAAPARHRGAMERSHAIESDSGGVRARPQQQFSNILGKISQARCQNTRQNTL